MNVAVEGPGAVLLIVALTLLPVISYAVFHAVRTRRAWNQGRDASVARVESLFGPVRTFNAVWGIDTIRAAGRIAALRGERPRPRLSPHFVVAVSDAALWIMYGARGDQGTTVIYPSEFRSISVGGVGPSVFTAWFIDCVIAGRRIKLPIRVSDPSSDFLIANYKWATEAAANISSHLTKGATREPGE